MNFKEEEEEKPKIQASLGGENLNLLNQELDN